MVQGYLKCLSTITMPNTLLEKLNAIFSMKVQGKAGSAIKSEARK